MLSIALFLFMGMTFLIPSNAFSQNATTPSETDHAALKKAHPPIKIENYIKGDNLSYTQFNLFFLPSDIKKFQSLKTIDLGYNHLFFLPPEIGELKNLETLSIICNKLRSLPLSIGNLQKLKELRLGYNHLKKLPSSFSKLKNLKMLRLTANPFQDIPPEIFSLKNLEEFIFASNSLTKIPEKIEVLKHLKILGLQDNEIKILPTQMKHLKNLETLSLNLNKIKNIDFTRYKRTNKKPLSLQVDQNPIENVRFNPYDRYIVPSITFNGTLFEDDSDFMRLADLLKKNVLGRVMIRFSNPSPYLNALGITHLTQVVRNPQTKKISFFENGKLQDFPLLTELFEIIGQSN